MKRRHQAQTRRRRWSRCGSSHLQNHCMRLQRPEGKDLHSVACRCVSLLRRSYWPKLQSRRGRILRVLQYGLNTSSAFTSKLFQSGGCLFTASVYPSCENFKQQTSGSYTTNRRAEESETWARFTLGPADECSEARGNNRLKEKGESENQECK